jgi:hypothetical protein
MGAYVKLLEYDNIDGMILLSELSRRRIRSIQKLIRVGRNEVVVVLRVDKEKGKGCTHAPHKASLHAGADGTILQDILIFQSDEYRRRMLSSVRSGTIRAKWFIRSCDMLPRRPITLSKTSTRRSAGL